MARRCRACLTVAKPRQRRCSACGRALPKKRKQAHMRALDRPFEDFLAANGGYPGCWVCRHLRIEMKGGVKRDHWHKGPLAGEPRGLLCTYHNRKLGAVYTPELVDAYAAYLERSAA